MKLSIIIPCYNEAGTIATVMGRVLSADLGNNIGKEIIVVNDGSTDQTSQILSAYHQDNIIIIDHQKNQGKTAAIISGLALATGEYTIIQDADLEYDPADIKNLLELAVAKNLPAVYGSRRLNKDNKYFYPTYYWGANFLNLLSNLFFRQKITDVETCYKLISTELLKSLNINSKNFIFCNEVTGKLSNLDIKIQEVPISYTPRSLKQGKKIKLRDGLAAIIATIKYRYKKPKQFNFFDRYLQKRRFKRIFKYLKPNTRLLDIGCGADFQLTEYTREFKIEYYGLDLKINSPLSNDVNLKQINFDQEKLLPYDANYFDFAVSLANLEHLEYYENNLQEIYRVLKPGGSLLLTTPTPLAQPILGTLAFLHIINPQEIRDHKRYFSAILLKNELVKAGFTEEKITHQYFQLGCNQSIVAIK